MQTDYVVVFVTTSSSEEAERIATALVSEQLAACVNILGPLRSIYRWQEQIESASEHLLIIKTRSALFSPLRARVAELHSYDTPEIIALPVTAGSDAYLQWLHASTRG